MTGTQGGLPCESEISINHHDEGDDKDDDGNVNGDDTPRKMTTSPRKIDKATA